MAEILTFRPRPAGRPANLPVSGLAPRQQLVTIPRVDLEEAAHAALDAAEKLIAVLDALDGDPDLEDGADSEPSLGAPEEHGNNVVWLRGTARDLELDQQPEITP